MNLSRLLIRDASSGQYWLKGGRLRLRDCLLTIDQSRVELRWVVARCRPIIHIPATCLRFTLSGVLVVLRVLSSSYSQMTTVKASIIFYWLCRGEVCALGLSGASLWIGAVAGGQEFD